MQRLAAFCVLMAATTVSVVAAPPYEPVKRSTSAGNIDPSSPYYSPSQNDSPSTSYGSGVKTYGTGGSTGGEDTPYAKPADASRSSTSSSASSTAGFDSYSYMQQMQQMQQEIQELRGAVEQLTHDMEMMQKQARERYLDLDSRINQLRGGTAAAAGAAVAADQGDAAGGSAVEASVEDKDLYDKASQLRRDGKYEESITVLEDLLKRSPDGLYAPYCDYWLGETYMAIKPPKLDLAKIHFISLLGNHPDHVKVPDAMYKLGKLFASQGENAKAKGTLNELIKKHPDKPAANLAKDLLKTL